MRWFRSSKQEYCNFFWNFCLPYVHVWHEEKERKKKRKRKGASATEQENESPNISEIVWVVETGIPTLNFLLPYVHGEKEREKEREKEGKRERKREREKEREREREKERKRERKSVKQQENTLPNAAYCIWSDFQSQSPISISLVSFQQNVPKET